LVERINFAADQVGDLTKPGVRRIMQRLAAMGSSLTPEQLVDGCLDLAGPVVVSAERREVLIASVPSSERGGCPTDESFGPTVARLLQLIVALREFQLS